MIKRILVPTDGSDFATVGVRYAVSLAAQHRATLLGLYVVDVRLLEGPFLRDISASLGTAPFVHYQSNINFILEQRGEAALNAFREQCAKANIACETVLETGVVWQVVAERGALTDLIVLGRGGEHHDFLQGLLGSTTEAVVRRAATPVLVTQRDEAKLRRFLVAYDGSQHGKKALQMGAAIGETWGIPFTVLTVGEAQGAAKLEEARAYLNAHEVRVEYVERGGDSSEAIIAYAGEGDMDLIVMGAFGHTKVRELVVGSTTASTINHAPCPVLLTR